MIKEYWMYRLIEAICAEDTETPDIDAEDVIIWLRDVIKQLNHNPDCISRAQWHEPIEDAESGKTIEPERYRWITKVDIGLLKDKPSGEIVVHHTIDPWAVMI